MSKTKKETSKDKKESGGVSTKQFFAPKIEDSVSISKDGRWIISKVTITSIKPVRYFEKMLGVGESASPAGDEAASDDAQG